jgi:RsiW-degrading membrane proteinase PrsW (M82 family)
MTQYMFDTSIPRATRALSLFHIWLPPALIWMVWRMGYDRRALAVQSIGGGIIVIASRLWTDPSENVNWAHRWPYLQEPWPVVLGVLLMPLVFYLPAHLLLSALMPAPAGP